MFFIEILYININIYIYILEIYMENNIISLLYETQCPVFDSDCSLFLSFSFFLFLSVSDLCVSFAVCCKCVTRWWEGLTKGKRAFLQGLFTGSWVQFQTSLFASSPVLSLFFPAPLLTRCSCYLSSLRLSRLLYDTM